MILLNHLDSSSVRDFGVIGNLKCFLVVAKDVKLKAVGGVHTVKTSRV